MRKYRLIKEYPGSPKLNTIVENHEKVNSANTLDKRYYYNGMKIQNYPEFWELVVEKDYEILEVKGRYGAISSYIEKLDSDLEDKTIFKIKRLSDGEIFTIGDLVGTPGSIYPLKEFKIIDSENTLAVHYYKDEIGGSGHYNHRLKNLKKAKPPIFQTEDGVDIFEGDIFYNTWDMKIPNKEIAISKKKDFYNEKPVNKLYKVFSTKEVAEEYILMNKPCLSLKDIDELLCKNTSSYFLEKFKKLVQQKLNK